MYDPVTMKLNVEPLIISALREDITSEDVSTNCVMPGYKTVSYTHLTLPTILLV